MPEHGSVLPRPRRGASRPLAAALSIALALLGTTVLALPASADDAPPVGDGIAPVVESPAPSPDPTPTPTSSDPAPAPAPAPDRTPTPTPSPTPSAPSSDGGIAPALDLGPMLAAAQAAPAGPISGPTTLAGTKGTSIVAVTYTADSLPRGRTLRVSDLPAGLATSTSGRTLTITGRPAAVGTSTMTVYIRGGLLDGYRTIAELPVTVTIAGPATISGNAQPSGTPNQAFTAQYTLGGFPVPTAATFEPALPSWLTSSVSGGKLTLSGTPTTTGTTTTTVTVDNGVGSARLDLTITVGVRPQISAIPEVYVGRDVPMTPVFVPVSGYPTPEVTDGPFPHALPAGLTLTAVPGGVEISGTPTTLYWWDADELVRLTAENAFGSGTGWLTFNIGDAPTISVTSPAPVVAGQSMAPIRVRVNGSYDPTVTSPDLPPTLTVAKTGGRWYVTGTPSRGEMGVHTYTLVATGAGTASTTLRLEVLAPPVITAPDQTFTAGGDATHTITAEAWPPATLTVEGLPAGLTVDNSEPGTLVVTGSTTALGTSTVTVRATNGVGPVVTTTYALSIVAAPVFTEDSMAVTVDAGQTMTPVELEAESHPAHTVSLAPGSAPLPAGLSIEPATGMLVGRPDASAAGVHTVTVRAENRLGYDDMTLEITVRAAPDIASTSGSRTFQLNQESSFTFTTSGWPAPTVSMAGLPDGLALEQVDATTWRVAGTVTDPGELGPHTIRATLTNSSATVSRTMTLKVMGFAWLQVPGDLVVEAGKTITPFVVSATAFGEPGYRGWIDPAPYPHPWITCGLNWSSGNDTRPNTDTWTCGGRAPAAAGQTALTFNVTYSVPIPARTIHISVVERPVIDAPDATVVADDDVSLPVTVTADPAPTSVTATGLPAGLSLEPTADGGWAIVGRVDRSTVGVYPVTITAANGLTGESLMTLTVGSRPVLPTADVVLGIGEPFAATVTADGSPAPTVEMTDGDLPDGLAWSGTGAVGSLEGSPTETGVWTYTVTATNDHGTVEQTYRVEVQQAATFADDTVSLTMVEGVAASRTLPLSGFPLPTVTTSGAIPGMTVEHTPGAAPVLTGTPAAGSAGTYTLVLTAGNHTVHGDMTDAVTIEVQVLAAPSLVGTGPLESTVGAVVDVPLVVGGAPAPAVTATGLPAGVELVQDDAGVWHLVGAPAPGTGGLHEVTITADNGVLSPATATMTLTVREPVSAVLAPAANLRVGTPATVTVRAQGGWPAPPALTVTGALPAGLRFVDQGNGTGQVVGTPAAGTAGSWQVTIVGDNGVGTARTTLTLAIAAAPAVTSPTLAAPPADVPGATPPPAATDPGDGDDDGDGDGESVGDDEAQAAPPVLDPEETISVERTARPWWWILGALLVGAVLLGLRTLERKLRSI